MADDKKRTYESTTLGVPALKMVLVHARNDAQNASPHVGKALVQLSPAEETPLDKEQMVRRIIEHLQASN